MKDKFIELLTEILEREEGLNFEDKLKDLEEWDSLAALSLVSMLDDEYGVIMGRKDFEKIETVEDVFNFVIKTKS